MEGSRSVSDIDTTDAVQRRHELSRGYRPPLCERLASPLTVAALATWLAISASVLDPQQLAQADLREWAGCTALLVMLALFLWRAIADPGTAAAAFNTLLQGVAVLAAEALLGRGQTVVLMIVVAGQLVLLMPLARAVAWLALFNLAVLALWIERSGSLLTALQWMLPVAGFQAFAGATGHYAGVSEQAREHLAQVNAELLATQRLLEETARGGERLKLSRELHDVAGHKLTAMKLNLARLLRDPALSDREELQVSRQLADELLDDIRSVVSELRQHDGLDLQSALQALARTVPGVEFVVEVESGLRVADLAQAEALLRCAQEAITNALRHGRGNRVELRCRQYAGAVVLTVEDDGQLAPVVRVGNGLTGMRERIEGLGGNLDIRPRAPRGLRVRAQLPMAAE